ncbi:hypothetical protein [Nostoc sp. LPT]|uniref:hypothetical protein n=1 Tax=Nostoc sp. LPT TaxID=2815387 RepID=UPI001D5F52FB|nr:hypothetical protein [Nostoc sp. LPT]MBN4002547.1 hypothetical protein [Nostoc sp. LPT]
MDFIKKLISGIQGFLGGILGFITGLLPGKKKSNGYFLELDEAKDAAKDAAKEVASNAKKVAETVTSTVASNAKKVAETISSEAPTPSKPDSLNGTKTAATKAKAKEKSAKEKSANNSKPADVQLVQTAEGLKVEPGKKAKAAAAKVLKEQPTETTFAPKYLAPSTTSSNGRRRPGANMSAYLDMARQIKTPK